MHFLCVVLVLVISSLRTDGADGTSCDERSSSGRKYIIAVMENNNYGSTGSINLNIVANSDGHLNMSSASLLPNRIYHLINGVTTISLNKTIMATKNGIEQKGIFLEADVDITVRVVIDGTGAQQEGYLALPVQCDVTSAYVVSSWKAYYPNQFLVASAADNTTVIVTAIGRQQTIVLNKFETYQRKYDSIDPSGTFIYATGPVSVLSGAQCSAVLFRYSCQTLLEQLVPVSNWGQSYITPALQSKNWNVVRIYTANDTATITFSNSSSTKTLHMTSFDYTTIIYQDEPMFIQSDRPVQVMLYSTGFYDDMHYTTGYSGDKVGDPFMMTIPDVNSFLSEYKMKPLALFTHDPDQPVYLTIIIDQTHETGLLLNGSSLTNIVNHTIVVTSQGHYHSVITVRLTVDVEYILRHRTPGVTFGALLYGYPHDRIAYGYPLGIKLRTEECSTTPSPSITHEPIMSTSSLSTSQPVTSSTHQPVTSSTHQSVTSLTHQPMTSSTRQYVTVQPGSALTCLACDDMLHVQYCDVIKHCAENEMCFLEKYTISGGNVRFRSGCAKQQECTDGSSHNGGVFVDGCKQCCSESYCNTKGCGENGLPPLASRGPICYACSYVVDTNECTTISLCNQGQVCRILEYPWGSLGSYYQLGCASEETCKTSSSHNARSTPSCHQCCNSDFCNTVCTQTVNHGVPIIG